MTEASRQTWYWQMLAPFAVLPSVVLRAFAIACPMIAVNVLTLFPYTRDYRFHYSAIVVAGCAVATVEGDRVDATPRRRQRDGAQRGRRDSSSWPPSSRRSSGVRHRSPVTTSSIWPCAPTRTSPCRSRPIDLLPDDAAVSAPYNIVPHITHRERVYEFPVPWCNINWGVDGENLDDPADVDWLILDRRLLGDSADAPPGPADERVHDPVRGARHRRRRTHARPRTDAPQAPGTVRVRGRPDRAVQAIVAPPSTGNV